MNSESTDRQYQRDQEWLHSVDPLETTREKIVKAKEMALEHWAKARKLEETSKKRLDEGDDELARGLTFAANTERKLAQEIEAVLALLF